MLLLLDRALTLTINNLHHPALDSLMVAFSGKFTWLPLYSFLAFLLYRRFGWRHTLIAVGAVALCVLFTDQVSVFLKEATARPRPCHTADMLPHMRIIDGCGGPFAFVSSHAANTAGLAVLVSLLIGRGWLWPLMLAYAAVNGYSRVYLGKHFVGDVLFGYLLGIALALLVYRLFLLVSSKISPS